MSLRSTVSATRAPRLALLRFAGSVVLGSAVLAMAAHVAVPFWPVPLTMQTLAVFLIGATAGPAAGAAAIMAYWVEALFGLPVLAHGAGIGALLGPTGGYVVGYIPAAVIAGFAARQSRDALGIATTVAMLLVADAILMMAGAAWLAGFVGWERAIAAGVLPFLLGDALKMALAVAAMQLRPTPARRRLRR